MKWLARTPLYLVLIVGAAISLVPFAWMLISSTHASSDLFATPPPLTFGDQLLANMRRLETDVHFTRVILNSLAIAVVYTVLSSAISAMCGYGLAKYRFRGRGILLGFILATMMIPMQVLLVPLFQMMASVGWIDTYAAVILPFAASAFGIFLMRQSFLSFPDELIEAARIDGAGDLRIFYRIALPTTKSSLAALVIYTFISQWNAFIWPLLMLNSEDNYTIPLALNTMVGLTKVDFSGLMLGSLLATLPVLVIFVAFQRQFVAGLLGGAVKG